MNIISDTLDILFKWLSERDKHKQCWPHSWKNKDNKIVCNKCGKQLKSSR